MESPNLARQAYAAQIRQLENEVLEMVSRAESMVAMAVDSLSRLDHAMGERVLEDDDAIDLQDVVIEQKCLKMLALQQPMGSDLREIGTIIKIITDIERIGDLAVDIAKIGFKIDREMGVTNYVDFPRMAYVARQMLREAVLAFIKRDLAGLEKIESLEDEVDAQYRDLRSQIHDYMRANPDQVVAASWMILAIHHVERIADHSVNIARRVGFMINGELGSQRHPEA